MALTPKWMQDVVDSRQIQDYADEVAPFIPQGELALLVVELFNRPAAEVFATTKKILAGLISKREPGFDVSPILSPPAGWEPVLMVGIDDQARLLYLNRTGQLVKGGEA